MPTPEAFREPASPRPEPGRRHQTGPMIVLVQGVSTVVVTAFLVTGSAAATMIVAGAAVGSLAVAREPG